MNDLHAIIAGEIKRHEWITFARFMELALYHPEHGYYEKKPARIGREGDYFTSVSVGSLFGELLAFQFADWLASLPHGGDENQREAVDSGSAIHDALPDSNAEQALQIVECGAHDGRLAFDMLSWIRKRRPAMLGQIRYWIIESSANRERLQRNMLRSFSQSVRWVRDWTAFPAGGVKGIVFTNELLDAFPVHRLGWDSAERRWFEWAVGMEGGAFTWKKLRSIPTPGIRPLERIGEMDPSGALLDMLPDGFTVEISLEAESWWARASSALRMGKLLTLDYGLTAEQFFSPQRANGTLRAYRNHRIVLDPLSEPGERDLTAHVNFSRLRSIGEKANLRTEAFCPQSPFLTNIASAAWKPEREFGQWTQKKTREFQTLTHPDHLGRPFQVLVQAR